MRSLAGVSAGGAQQLTGIVDYVAAWSRTLTDAEAKRISAETSAVAVTKVDAAVNALHPIISDTGARKNIVFVGGETIEGGYTDHLIARTSCSCSTSACAGNTSPG